MTSSECIRILDRDYAPLFKKARDEYLYATKTWRKQGKSCVRYSKVKHDFDYIIKKLEQK